MNTITYEPFTGHFTGRLSTITTVSGLLCKFKYPLPRIEKGKRYMLKIDKKTGQCTFLQLVAPE